MEFDDMKKIWDTQNNQPLYAIDEAALFRRIQAKRKRAGRTSNINELGLIIVMLTTSIILFFLDKGALYSYTSALIMVCIAGYIGYRRFIRKQGERDFDRSVLGELDLAIHRTTSEIKRAQTFIWWMLLPVSIPMIVNITHTGITSWKWLLVLIAFGLAYYLTQWELKNCLLPRKEELEKLKDLLNSA